MNSERFWVLIFAATTFCAGLAAGVLLTPQFRSAHAERPFGAYETQMVAAFDLGEEQVKNLRWILQQYQEKLEALKERNLAVLDSDLVKIGQECRDKIADHVIPAYHRQQFDQWVKGQPVLSGAKLQ